MCGIFGFAGGAGLRREDLLAMAAALAHRGPDGEGYWGSADGWCALGHKRLSIIDPEGGKQPLANEDESIWITFNGCIYNYEDLARQLRQKGHRFRTHCDTEVIVHAYEEWGEDCVNHFNGMWGFALYDVREQRLFCSRDRIGVKPFYYAWDGKTFTFASEIKALLAAGAVVPEVSTNGLRHYLTFQFCLGPETLFRNVWKLEPGWNLVLPRSGGPQLRRYWDLHFDHIDTTRSADYFAQHLEASIQDAIRLRLRADVPLGAHLSGGADSSTVVCMARALLGDCPVKTFTGAFREGRGFDETHYARQVAEYAKTEYLETYLGPMEFADSIAKIIWHMDEPAAGPGVFPQYWVSKLASEHVKVVLGGQGGDENFIGYARYLVAYLEECIKGAIEDTAHRHRYVATLSSIVPSLPTLEGYKPMLAEFWRDGLFDEPAQRYFRLMDRFSDCGDLLQEPFTASQRQATFEEFKAIFDNHEAAAKINRIMYFDMKTHLQALLQVEDRTSMAWGLESRVPLLDYRIVELMAAIPPVIKFKNGELKHIFKAAIKNWIPPPIYERKDKMGFPVPLNRWMKAELRDFAGDILLGSAARKRGLFRPAALEAALASSTPFGRGLWGALCLELWFQQFLDRDVRHRP